MTALFSSVVAGWLTSDVAIDIIIIAAIFALVGVALHEFGTKIPGWVIRCFWTIAIAFVVILCIRFVRTL